MPPRPDAESWMPQAPSAALAAGLDALAAGRLADARLHLSACPEAATIPEVAYRLGVAQSLIGDPAGAIATWRRTLRIDAAFAPALFDLALAYQSVEDLPQAALTFSRLITFHPDHAEGRFNFGNLLFRLGRTEEAVAMYAPLTDSPAPPRGILVNLGRSLRRLGRLAEADACYRRALLDDPDDHFTHWNRAHVLFLLERWEEGFAAWEHRLDAGMKPPVAPALPQWPGGDAPLPQRLLVVGEQGHGDALQCLRYLPILAARGTMPTLVLHDSLLRLARTLLPEVPCIGFAAAKTAAAEAWVPLFSLPHRMRLPHPAAAPEPAAAPAFAAGLAAIRAAAPAHGARPRIGIAWAGNPDHDNDRWRSMRLADLAPLLAARPDLDWHSLQIGAAASEAEAPGLPPLARHEAEIADFADTARLIAGFDLMICVDTAVAHVAASLGVPTWIFLAAEPDWRWGQTGDRTPWYASARLFRQTVLGDWNAPLADAGAALAAAFPPGGTP